MGSKKRNKKKKAAYRRGEKMALFFKRGSVLLLFVIFAAAAFLGIKKLAAQFSVKEIVISGINHIEKEDILRVLNIKGGESLVDLHLDGVDRRLKENPWVKGVAMRKQYPDKLVVKIEEAVPAALLDIKKKLYLLDRDGEILENIQGETVPFLPVIKNIDPRNSKDLSEALKLSEVLSGKGGLTERESIIIGLESYGLSAEIDGEFIKVGYGGYSEKIGRWAELEPEIRKRGVPIKYVDLRFKDSVIVKPLERNKGEKSS